jgi:hypothetical protein
MKKTTLLQYLKSRYRPETLRLLQMPPCDVRAYVDTMPSEARDECRRQMEGIAYFAAAYATYLDYRHGHGCGDQGHKDADKAALKTANTLWTKVFGYNAHPCGSHFIP